MKTANHIFIRYTPRVVKEFMIRRVYRVIAGTGMTTTLSNLGFQKPAPVVEKKLNRFEMYLGAGGGGMTASAVGCGQAGIPVHQRILAEPVCGACVGGNFAERRHSIHRQRGKNSAISKNKRKRHSQSVSL